MGLGKFEIVLNKSKMLSKKSVQLPKIYEVAITEHLSKA